MFAEGTVRHWDLAPDPLFDACRMEQVPAVIDPSKSLPSFEVIEADAARVLRDSL